MMNVKEKWELFCKHWLRWVVENLQYAISRDFTWNGHFIFELFENYVFDKRAVKLRWWNGTNIHLLIYTQIIELKRMLIVITKEIYLKIL